MEAWLKSRKVDAIDPALKYVQAAFFNLHGKLLFRRNALKNLAAHHQSLSLSTKEKTMQMAKKNSKPGKSMTSVILSLICLTTNAFALELNNETKQVIANEFLKCAYSTEKVSQEKSALCGCTMDGVYRKYSLKQLQTNAQAILQEEQKTCMNLLK